MAKGARTFVFVLSTVVPRDSSAVALPRVQMGSRPADFSQRMGPAAVCRVTAELDAVVSDSRSAYLTFPRPVAEEAIQSLDLY